MIKLNKNKIVTQKEIEDMFYEHIVKNGKEYSKFKLTLIRPGIVGEKIETIVESGLETTKVVAEREYVVQAITAAKEQYVITEEKFLTRYELSKEDIPSEYANTEFKLYNPSGRIMGIKAKDIMEGEEIFFIAPWGESMKLQPEDILAAPIGLKPELYRIAWAEFLQTYK